MKGKILQIVALMASVLLTNVNGARAQWNAVGPATGPGFSVFCLRSFGGNLYAGGGTGMSKWDGTSWTSMGRVAPTTPLGMGSIGVNCMVDYNGSLYVGGDIDSMGGVYVDHTIGVAKWNGTTWEKVGASAPDLGGVTTLVVYHGDLYASGNNGVNKWDGTTWTSVGTVDGPANVVLAVYHDELYAASSFSHIGSATMTTGKGFAKWNGTSWTALTGFYDTLSALPNINIAKASAMMVFKDELYVIGALDWAGATFTRGVARWNGTTWNPTNGGIKGNGTLVSNCMSKDSNYLYVVGPIQRVNTANDSVFLSAYWDGTSWHHMFGGTAPYASFFATENFNGTIYSAYTTLAKWDGATAAGVPGIESAIGVGVYPNPARGIVHVSFGSGRSKLISVSTVAGVSVYTKEVNNAETGMAIDLGNMPAGLYFVTVNDGNTVETRKVMIER